MPYPVGYSKDRKIFLENVFTRFPTLSLRKAFQDCEKSNPDSRIADLREKTTEICRLIWTNLGIPDAETLAEHTGGMVCLAARFPQREFDYDETMAMINVWGLTRAVANEIPFEQMDREERYKFHELTAQLIFGRHQNFDIWNTLHSDIWKERKDTTCTTSDWVSDLDFLVTASKAQEYKIQYPHLSDTLSGIVETCRQSLRTSQGIALFPRIISPHNALPRLAP